MSSQRRGLFPSRTLPNQQDRGDRHNHSGYLERARTERVDRHQSRRRQSNPDRYGGPGSRRRSPSAEPPLPAPMTQVHARRSRRHFDQQRLHMPSWSWIPMVVCVISMTLFASIFGAFGVMFASLAYADHKVKDYGGSKYKGRWSLVCGVLGMVVTTLALVFLLITMFTIKITKPTFDHYMYWIPPWLLERIRDES